MSWNTEELVCYTAGRIKLFYPVNFGIMFIKPLLMFFYVDEFLLIPKRIDVPDVKNIQKQVILPNASAMHISRNFARMILQKNLAWCNCCNFENNALECITECSNERSFQWRYLQCHWSGNGSKWTHGTSWKNVFNIGKCEIKLILCIVFIAPYYELWSWIQ